MIEANMHLSHTFVFTFNLGIKETLETLNRSIEEKFFVCQDIYINICKPLHSKMAEEVIESIFTEAERENIKISV